MSIKRDAKGRIVKGSTMTREERLKANRNMRAAWKERDDYIGDIKEANPRIFNSWRAILYTQKGQKAGCVEEWRSFRKFYEDVSPEYKRGLVLRRKDVARPWSPDNFVWVTMEEAGNMKSQRQIEYNGETHNLREWSEILNVSYQGIHLRYARREKKGLSAKDILFGVRVSRGSKAPKDIRDEGVRIRAKASKMISSYKILDRKNGYPVCDITIDWMIANILTKPCTYCGDTKRVGCDRIDNDRGHTMDNVVPCCVECNAIRNRFFSYEEMKELGRAVREIKAKREIK